METKTIDPKWYQGEVPPTPGLYVAAIKGIALEDCISDLVMWDGEKGQVLGDFSGDGAACYALSMANDRENVLFYGPIPQPEGVPVELGEPAERETVDTRTLTDLEFTIYYDGQGREHREF